MSNEEDFVLGEDVTELFNPHWREKWRVKLKEQARWVREHPTPIIVSDLQWWIDFGQYGVPPPTEDLTKSKE